ncbi:hypothetical protein SKAU_G00107920 [Synaphobranchus kaupii]|uniref:Uncharacterized protein n=1 Tax=Synaphobranchus kaupii TaxID=118154 RepID=A0A9Q1FZK6_SYNKA|nr:hypothetical protein SKAU_G00107920 [Synaphobranchus kaupii]
MSLAHAGLTSDPRRLVVPASLPLSWLFQPCTSWGTSRQDSPQPTPSHLNLPKSCRSLAVNLHLSQLSSHLTFCCQDLDPRDPDERACWSITAPS